MSIFTQVNSTLPSLFEVISFPPNEAVRLLKKLHENIMNTLEGIPSRTTSATRYLRAAIQPYINNPDFRTIYLVPHSHSEISPSHQTTLSLHHIFISLLRVNTLPASYNRNLLFCKFQNDRFIPLPEKAQAAITEALSALQDIQFYLSDLTPFWDTQHPQSELTIREYLAHALALQLQCVCILKVSDRSLRLYNITLPCLLATPDHFVSSHLYRLSADSETRKLQRHLEGAFVIAHYPQDPSDRANFCTLYIPSHCVQAFDSVALLKGYLTNLFSDDRISLIPASFGEHFYNDQVQIMIDKHRQDIQYEWSKAKEKNKLYEERYANYITGDANQLFPHTLTFAEELAKYQLPGMTRNCEELPRPKPQLISSTLSPIKIHVFLHQDLADRYTTDSLYETNFSWFKAEIESISGREVIVIFPTHDTAEELTTYEYQSKSGTEAVLGWSALIHKLFPETTRHSALDVYLLLTTFMFGNDNTGFASVENRTAIAAVTPDDVAGHEIGHLFDANHAHGGVIYDSCWSNTLMNSETPLLPPGRKAYRFSPRNRENIQLYLSQFD